MDQVKLKIIYLYLCAKYKLIEKLFLKGLDSMANAVENSCCVLMCVTEKYRQSINCQAEAQYAFKLTKPIIPCIMQKGCENVTGWLGIIIGDKVI